MNRRQSLLALLAAAPVAAGAAAQAAGKAKPEERQELDPRYLDVHNLAIPVVRDRQLMSYHFCTVRVELTDKGNQRPVRERAHFLRDALLRASHREDLSDLKAQGAIDSAKAVRVFTAEALQALGAETVRGIVLSAPRTLQIR